LKKAFRKTPLIERMESRLLLAAHTWTGAADAFWSNPANWIGGSPSPSETNVTLDFPANAVITSMNNNVVGLSIQSVTFEKSYSLAGNGLTLASSIQTGGFSINWSVPITLASDVTFGYGTTLASNPATLVLNSAIGGIGNVTIAPGSSVTFASTAPNTYGGTTTVNGTLNLDANTGDAPIAIAGNVLSGPASVPFNLTINSGGTVNVQSYFFQIAAAATVDVEAGGNLIMSGETELVAGLSGAGTISGSGRFVVWRGGEFSGVVGGSVSMGAGAVATLILDSSVSSPTTGIVGQFSGTVLLSNAQLPNAQVTDSNFLGDLSFVLFRGWPGKITGGGTIGSLTAVSQIIAPGGLGINPLDVLGNVTLGQNSTLLIDTLLGPLRRLPRAGQSPCPAARCNLLTASVHAIPGPHAARSSRLSTIRAISRSPELSTTCPTAR
jgi:hypothetical protein